MKTDITDVWNDFASLKRATGILESVAEYVLFQLRPLELEPDHRVFHSNGHPITEIGGKLYKVCVEEMAKDVRFDGLEVIAHTKPMKHMRCNFIEFSHFDMCHNVSVDFVEHAYYSIEYHNARLSEAEMEERAKFSPHMGDMSQVLRYMKGDTD
tara:strand:- start:45 stop:506 length:462 start_codon:yes stop_codon:yes gene_type:complete